MFREPWEAHAFAMAVRLHEQGLFTWPQWAATLAEEIKRTVFKINRVGGLTKARRIRDFCLQTGIAMLIMDSGGSQQLS